MSFAIEVIPRPDATPQELTELGLAIVKFRVWNRRHERSGVPHFCPFDTLLLGEMPRWPLYLSAEPRHPSPTATPGPGKPDKERDPSAILKAWQRGEQYTLGEVVEAIRRFIPGESVRDIVIDGTSWAEVDPQSTQANGEQPGPRGEA